MIAADLQNGGRFVNSFCALGLSVPALRELGGEAAAELERASEPNWRWKSGITPN